MKPNAVAAVILPSSILNKENESFICARESILKNFKIRAIVLMGNKTFGATGTNTVVLFLEKYNEPPKKADLIEDSIDAVFNGCNLDGWEDKAILEQYLKKIDVSSEVYERFLSEAVDIGDIEDKYFLKYKEAFLALSKTKEKQKQKTFGKLSEKEQKKLLTKQYYQYVKKIEREKMKYFSFVYDQRTLIVAAPDDNKGQEKFLGYKWSNRKGQEGIQIIDEGGMLYDAENRMSDRTIASLIRKMFNGEEVSLDDLEEYYYYLHTKDMISFSEVYFNKAIKTTKTRLLKDDPGLTVYSLSDEKTFDITIGDRVLSEEIVSGGRVPVYSANVYEEFGRIDTHGEYFRYKTPLTGRLNAGTYPQRNTKAGIGAATYIVGTEAAGFIFTAPAAGTKPYRNTVFSQQAAHIDADTALNTFGYTNTPAGRIKAGEQPQRNTRGQTSGVTVMASDRMEAHRFTVPAAGTVPERSTVQRTQGGAVGTSTQAMGFSYGVKPCGSHRKL